ncbi:hypothetical protein ACP4OV_018651 [Aristida adscensionis]
MARSIIRALLVVVAVAMAAVVGTARGASYTVGAPEGSWDTRTNLTRWASTIIFQAGDQLVFKGHSHVVIEAGSKAEYDACSGSNPVAVFHAGVDTVPLPIAGVTRYFICNVTGHCQAGMKLAVTVHDAAAPSPAMAPSSSAAAAAGVESPVIGLALAAVVALLS